MKIISRIWFAFQVERRLRAGNLHAGEEYCRKQISRYPRVAFFHETLAKVLLRLERIEEAISEYRLAIALQGDASIIDRENLIDLLRKNGKHEEIIAETDKLLASTSKLTGLRKAMAQFVAYQNRATAFFALGNYLEAKRSLQHCLKYSNSKSRVEIQKWLEQCESKLSDDTDYSTGPTG